MKQQHSSTTTSQSVSRSVTQSTSQPSSLPEHCNHRQKQHPQSSTIRANHASTWLVYVQLPCSRRACTKSSSPSSWSHISLHHTARTDQQQEQHKPNESPQRQNPIQPTSTRASSSKWQCQRKGGAPNHSHISTYPIRLMPEKSAIESMMPQARSPEAKKGGRGVQ